MSAPPIAPNQAASRLPPPPENPIVVVPSNGYDLLAIAARSTTALLPPVVYDARQAALQAVLYLNGRPLEILVTQAEPTAPLIVYGLPKDPPDTLREQLHTVLGLDDDLTLFYALCSHDPELAWAPDRDAARHLRCATVFEDLVKVLLWTRAPAPRAEELALGLCQKLGKLSNLGRPTFPDATAMAAAKGRIYEHVLSAGPLAKPLHKLAERCASGALFPESLRRPPLPLMTLLSDEDRFADAVDGELEWQFRVERLLMSLPGFGPRACALMLPLLGCHDRLSLDIEKLRAWQKRFGAARAEKLSHRDTRASRVATAIERRVAPYLLYGGLAQRLLLHQDA